MASRRGVFTTSVGTKILIGITGAALVLYLIVHIAGNLLVFGGPAFFNKYAYTLEGSPLIPIIEIGLLLIFLLHIYKTLRMFLDNQQARPVAYVRNVRRRLRRPAAADDAVASFVESCFPTRDLVAAALT